MGREDCAQFVHPHKLFLLWCLAHDQSTNLGYFVAKHLFKIGTKPKSAIMVGGIVAKLAITLRISMKTMKKASGGSLIDSYFLTKIGALTIQATYFFVAPW